MSMTETIKVEGRPHALLDDSTRRSRLIQEDSDAARFFHHGRIKPNLVAHLTETLNRLAKDGSWNSQLHVVRAPELVTNSGERLDRATAITGEWINGYQSALYGLYVRLNHDVTAGRERQQRALSQGMFLMEQTAHIDVIRFNPYELDDFEESRRYLGSLTARPGSDIVATEGIPGGRKVMVAAQIGELQQIACLALEAVTPNPDDRELLAAHACS